MSGKQRPENYKRRRGFRGKVLLTSLWNFSPRTIVGAYEVDGELYLELENGDAIKEQFVHMFADVEEARNHYNIAR